MTYDDITIKVSAAGEVVIIIQGPDKTHEVRLTSSQAWALSAKLYGARDQALELKR